ncbi:putative arsenite methyltransferase [Hypsizygus marmoreus]|uniref:Arsenite methyltransferase n=1 Tax=Hypsizygus marmoreus TaxID=39966 RepID=A0A369J6F7_HYPMA|nr:putative arsenite methyltransferase [Hypsizygus marmoreus]
MSINLPEISDVALVSVVGNAYSEKARCGTVSARAKELAGSVGYTQDDLQSIPDAAQLGVGCGNPVASVNLKGGEILIDLGSGGGIDVFLAASKVGPNGQVIGIDVSPDMVDLARRNAKRQGLKPPHVAFIQASLAEPLPITSNSVDYVFSNCVINLLPPAGKSNLLKEVNRVLKPGGRIVFDDILAKQPLSEDIRNDLRAYVSCIAGSIQVEDYKTLLDTAGFLDARFVETKNDLQAICSGCCPKAPAPATLDVNSLVASYQISAVKSNASNAENAPTSPLLRWWDAYPTVKSTPSLISQDELADLVRSETGSQSDFAVIDVRRNDHAGGHVRGSDNWHAQTFYDDLPAFFEKYRNTSRVTFYCGSSSGRGPRCAGWYQDYLNETGTTTSAAYVLQGGVKAWLAKFGNEDRFVDKD